MRTRVHSLIVIGILALVAPMRAAAEDGVFQIKNATTAGQLQELATVIRGMTDSPQVSTDTASRTLAVRGTVDDTALAAWLVSKLDDDPLQDQQSATAEYQMPGGGDVVRVFYLDASATTRDLQEVVTTLRSTTDARRLLVLAAPNAIVFRGEAAKADMTEWLFDELNDPANWQAPGQRPPDSGAREYQSPRNSDDVVRVFYLTHSTNPQQDMTLIRRQTRIPRVFYCRTPKAMTVRGTAGQIAQVEGMVAELSSRP